MTRKHYIAFARVLSDTRSLVWDNVGYAVIDMIEKEMVTLFYEDNPNFSGEKFRKAASLEPEIT